LIGESATFQEVLRQIPLFARCDATVLLEGETGTGKEVCARALHYLSPRSDHPFVPVNCGAIPLELVENELFGHERSAYTGATQTQQGLVAAAEGGTLFLDEIDSLTAAAQVKLLRLLEQKEYRPLGSTCSRTADVRLLAATNTESAACVRAGRLRQDFYYRLNVLQVRLPPLRERPGDVLLLARHFLARFAARLHQPVPTLSEPALKTLLGHDWPGNVRELEHVLERAVVLAAGRSVIGRADIVLPLVSEPQPQSFRDAKARAVARFERTYIENLLAAFQGNITRAAQAGQKNRRAFWELIRKYGIDPRAYRPGN
jgi:transcriptional regulator with PAS, ATPase and Fis domain